MLRIRAHFTPMGPTAAMTVESDHDLSRDFVIAHEPPRRTAMRYSKRAAEWAY